MEHKGMQKIPPFLALPAELHDDISSYLDLDTLVRLRQVCRRANTLYEHKHTQRAGFKLWLAIQEKRPIYFPLLSEVDLEYHNFIRGAPNYFSTWGEADRTEIFSISSTMSWRQISENWHSAITPIVRRDQGARRPFRNLILESEQALPLAEMKRQIRIRFYHSNELTPDQPLASFPPQKIESMLRAIGSWDVVEDVFIMLLWAIGFRGPICRRKNDQKQTGTVAMLARRTVELGPPKSKMLLKVLRGALSPNEHSQHLGFSESAFEGTSKRFKIL